MNEKLFRTQFNQMETTEKQALMESLAARYDMTFLGLHTFDRWGQNCTTGIFKKDGRRHSTQTLESQKCSRDFHAYWANH